MMNITPGGDYPTTPNYLMDPGDHRRRIRQEESKRFGLSESWGGQFSALIADESLERTGDTVQPFPRPVQTAAINGGTPKVNVLLCELVGGRLRAMTTQFPAKSSDPKCLQQRRDLAMIVAMADADVTRILEDLAAGRRESAEALLPLVYQQLRAIAKQRMAGERHDHTLQATALVHEAYVKLVGDGGQVNWSGRAAFFKAAAEAMRRILIDHARSRGRVKRGGDHAAKRVPLSVLDLAADADSEDILALDEAITRLEEADPEVASVVRLRFFAGLTVDDTAAALNISPRQADRHWAYARAWLFKRLSEQEQQ